MKLPIPFDWDGSTWTRFSICWPDSVQWRALLVGFITYATRGRAWDEKTGNIKATQAIGKQIFENNFPLDEVIVSCKDANLLIKSNLLMVAALTGTQVNLVDMDNEALETYFNQNFDFTATGLANRIGPQVTHSDPNTLQATLERVKLALDDVAQGDETDWPGLFASLNQAIGDAMPIINNYVECGGCGGGISICGGTGGTGGAGSTPADPSDTQTDPASQQGPPPDGFEDWPEYNDYKCRAAHFIINQMISDIAQTSLITAVGLTVSELGLLLVAAILTPIPGDGIVVVAWIMIQIAATALAYSEIITFLEANKNELACSILNGSSVGDSINEFTTAVSSLIAQDAGISGYGEYVSGLAAQYINSFATIDSFNRLYEKQNQNYPAADCSACSEGILWSFENDQESWAFVAGDNTGGTPSGNWENGALALKFDRVTTGLIAGQWWYSGPLISEIQEGMTFRAEFEGINPCASGAGLGILFTDATFQWVGDGNAWAFDEIREVSLVVEPFNGRIIQSIWIDSHTEVPCTTPGQYQMNINWVEIK